MKIKMKEIGLVICFTSLSLSAAFAQKVTIDAEFRPRVEFADGFKSPTLVDRNAAGLVLQRTRFGASYETNWLNARLTLQDSRTYGEVDTKQPTSATTGSVGLYEAWADLLVLPGVSFKIGRQGVQFEDGRLFSLSNWSNTGVSHDMAQLAYSISGFNGELGYAYNNKSATYSDTATAYNATSVTMYKQLEFIHLTKSIVDELNISVLGVGEGFQQNVSKDKVLLEQRYTTGGTITFKNDSLPFDIFFTGYYQFGRGYYPDKFISKNTSVSKKLNAYLLAIKANYKITQKLGVNVGVDYFSGSKLGGDTTTTTTFNKLPYGANHSFDGGMEYWSTIPSGGLIDYSGGLTFKFNDKWNIAGTYYANFLARDMKVTNKTTKVTYDVTNNLGSEIDLVLNYKFSPEANVQLGWSTYFVTDGTKVLKYQSTNVSTQFPQYAYLMLTIKPKFLVSK